MSCGDFLSMVPDAWDEFGFPMELDDVSIPLGDALNPGAEVLYNQSARPEFIRMPSLPLTLQLNTNISVQDHHISDVFADAQASSSQDKDQPTLTEPNILGPNHILTRFSKPSYDHLILDHNDQRISVSLSAQLHGSFFLDDAQCIGSPRAELTCYRRNIYRVAGSVTLPRSSHCILTQDGHRLPISDLELTISAVESIEGAPAKIVSVAQKPSSLHGSSFANDKAERDPRPMRLDFTEAQTVGEDFANFPFEWKRLQFRSATANNGRRRELQQHYTVCIGVMARVAGGQHQRLCVVRSNPIIVRGRNPASFQARRESALRAAGKEPVPKSPTTRSKPRRATNPPIQSKPNGPPSASIIEPEPSVVAYSDFSAEPSDYFSQLWNTSTAHVEDDLMTTFTQISPLADKCGPTLGPVSDNWPLADPVPDSSSAIIIVDDDEVLEVPVGNAVAITDQIAAPKLARNPTTPGYRPPIPLSLLDEEAPFQPADFNDSSYLPQERSRKRKWPIGSPTPLSGAEDAVDTLYEYFPLSFDEWLPPVQAIYRPHVVHHCLNIPNPRDPDSSGRVQGRSTRYFAEGSRHSY
ncbi:hypothetical protein ANO11243_027270 [Dothideomycetidae sp. 11243]|nr:hypothetical protein ANO11243_027270 [fungal sp. No.11243]